MRMGRMTPPPSIRRSDRPLRNRRPFAAAGTAGRRAGTIQQAEAIVVSPGVRTHKDEATVGSGPGPEETRPGPENREAAGVRGTRMPIARAQAPGAFVARIRRGIGLRLLVGVVLFSSGITLVLTLLQ